MADNVLFYDPLLVNTKTNKVSLEKENYYSHDLGSGLSWVEKLKTFPKLRKLISVQFYTKKRNDLRQTC